MSKKCMRIRPIWIVLVGGLYFGMVLFVAPYLAWYDLLFAILSCLLVGLGCVHFWFHRWIDGQERWR